MQIMSHVTYSQAVLVTAAANCPATSAGIHWQQAGSSVTMSVAVVERDLRASAALQIILGAEHAVSRVNWKLVLNAPRMEIDAERQKHLCV